MKEQIASLTRIGKRVAILLVLIVSTLFLVSRPNPVHAVVDCFSSCDDQYTSCINSCCIVHSDGSVDCSGCSACVDNYGSCASPCFGSVGSGRCPHQAGCQTQAGREYAQCMANELNGECANPDGTINASCCNNDAVQEYFGCCYP